MNCTRAGIDCNECMPNNLMRESAYRIIAELEKKDEDVIKTVNKNCPNLSVCPECCVDDFCHVEGCSIGKELDEVEKELKGKKNE